MKCKCCLDKDEMTFNGDKDWYNDTIDIVNGILQIIK